MEITVKLPTDPDISWPKTERGLYPEITSRIKGNATMTHKVSTHPMILSPTPAAVDSLLVDIVIDLAPSVRHGPANRLVDSFSERKFLQAAVEHDSHSV